MYLQTHNIYAKLSQPAACPGQQKVRGVRGPGFQGALLIYGKGIIDSRDMPSATATATSAISLRILRALRFMVALCVYYTAHATLLRPAAALLPARDHTLRSGSVKRVSLAFELSNRQFQHPIGCRKTNA
jgi:hypothetical protein